MEKSKRMAATSFAFGLAFWIPLLNFVFGALAIYLGIKALLKIKQEPDKYAGKFFAIIGIILGALPIALYLTILVKCLIEYGEVCKAIGLTFLA